MPNARFLLGRSPRPSIQRRLIHQSGQRHLGQDDATPATGNVEKRTRPRTYPSSSRGGTLTGVLDAKPLPEQHREPQRLGRYILSARLASMRYDFKPLALAQSISIDRRLRWLRRQCLYLSSLSDRGRGDISAFRFCYQIAGFLPIVARAAATLTNGQELLNSYNKDKANANTATSRDTQSHLESYGFLERNTASLSVAEYKDVLRMYNSIFNRLCKSTEDHISLANYGQLLGSGARNIVALRFYTDTLTSQASSATVLPETLLNLRLWLEEDVFEGQHGQEKRSELIDIVLGSPESRDDRESPEGFRKLCSLLDLDIRSGYFGVLARLDPQFIWHEWCGIMNSAYWKQLKNNVLAAQSDASALGNAKAARVEIQNLVHDVVANLILGGEPATAWEVVRTLDPHLADIQSRTWSLLLDFPEHLTLWNDSMRDPVMQKYEEHLSKLEEALGVEWTGGEDGSHTFIGEDQASTEAIIEYHHSTRP